jgi:hypothetical protein
MAWIQHHPQPPAPQQDPVLLSIPKDELELRLGELTELSYQIRDIKNRIGAAVVQHNENVELENLVEDE